MVPPATTLLVCSAMFIWAASASVGADPDSAEEHSIQCDVRSGSCAGTGGGLELKAFGVQVNSGRH